MEPYQLSASLKGHEDDVRGVVFVDAETVFSASRDATVRLWKLLSPKPPSYDCTLISHGSAFVNSIAFIPPSSEFPEGLVISGGKDMIIEVKKPTKTSQEHSDALLLGHSHNVCALDVDEDGRTIVSGSWDAEARIWEVGKWETSAVLQGHNGSVWAVLMYDHNTVLTGCADKIIRVFNRGGKLLRTIKGSSDVVRALCKLPQHHPSGAQFASAGNDAIIRLWTLEGVEIAQLNGHENFIYSIASTPNGDIVSGSEDRSVRIWRGQQCVQTITHPAISVWAVAVCPDNGDIVTGASDRIVRVFTQSKERLAEPAALSAFEESVKESSIPQQSLGDINKEKLPGPDFLSKKSGTKEGQVQMIKELNGNISAYQWSTAAQQWISVGTVVDAVGSSGRKITYNGQDYDYVFDVDIEDGKPPLKLPYNLSQNPYEVARKFIADNELPQSYLDQVTNFIVTNTQGATLGQQTQAPGSDPWGTESRYRPGDADAASSAVSSSSPRVLPQTTFLSITTANLKIIHKKLLEFNDAIISSGSKDLSLNPSDQNVLAALIKQLERTVAGTTNPALSSGVEIVVKISTKWPSEKRLPGLDMLRLLAVACPSVVSYTSTGDGTLVDELAASGLFAPESPPNNTMMAVRAVANLFSTEEGRLIVDGEYDKIRGLLDAHMKTKNRNLAIALATLYVNYSVLVSASEASTDPDRPLALLGDVVGLLKTFEDAEALYRGLVAAGTLLSLGPELREAAKSVFDLETAMKRAESTGKEPRIRNVIKEMREHLS